MEGLKLIVIVDYKMGNLPNVKRAVELFTKDVIISSDVEEIKKAEKILLPGVGAFGDAIRNIEELGLREAIVEASKTKPFMGICLGMQLMFEKSEEDLSVEGLGIIKGRVEKFKNIDLKIPEIGWNSVSKPKESKILNGLENNSYFYFVHSFHVVPEEEVAAGITNYGYDFVSVIEKDNIMATQFHPEKSHDEGLKILKNFIDM
jgi:imidazole glycerol-phosphate synthase subunit HisH